MQEVKRPKPNGVGLKELIRIYGIQDYSIEDLFPPMSLEETQKELDKRARDFQLEDARITAELLGEQQHGLVDKIVAYTQGLHDGRAYLEELQFKELFNELHVNLPKEIPQLDMSKMPKVDYKLPELKSEVVYKSGDVRSAVEQKSLYDAMTADFGSVVADKVLNEHVSLVKVKRVSNKSGVCNTCNKLF